MAAHRCSICNVHWPPTFQYRQCPDCGSPTWYSPSNEPDEPDPPTATAVAPATGTQATSSTVEHAWRVDRYLELGFTVVDANLLATARDTVCVNDRGGRARTWTFPLDWQKVARALDAGCPHAQALAIFT